MTNIKRWVLPAVRVGAVSAGNLTLAGQVTVPDVCVSSKVKLTAPVPGLEKVNVELLLIVLVK